MALPTFSQIVQSMITFLQGKRPNIATNTGSVTNDVVISTVANQLSAQNGTDPSVYENIAYSQELQAFAVDAALLVPTDLDNIGANYGMTRNPPVAATGVETFRIRNYTTSSPIITVNSGTTISTLATISSPAVSFATTAGVTFTPSLAPSYFNPATGFYEQSTTIVCQTTGAVGNVGAQVITSLVSSVPGIDAVTNTVSTTGGADTESNTAFAARIQIKLEGNNVGTPNGIISLVNTNPSVQQAIVVGPNDSEMQRDQFGGSVDVYIKGQILTTVSDTDMYTTAGAQSFVLNHQPALSVGSVTGIQGGNPYTFVPNTDYAVVINPNNLFAGSTEAASYITFDVKTYVTVVSAPDGTHIEVNTTTGMQTGDTIYQSTFSTNIVNVVDGSHIEVGDSTGFGAGPVASFTGFKPDTGTIITITYTYDSLIETLQALFNSNDNHIVASDILVKEALEAFISITNSIIVLPGYVPATVVTNIQSSLSTYINGLGLGAVIDLSDVVVVEELVAGVDQVDLSTLTISSTIGVTTTSIPPGQRISVGKLAYTVPGTLAISVE